MPSLDPETSGWTVQITEHDDGFVASSEGVSANGDTPGAAVQSLYRTLF